MRFVVRYWQLLLTIAAVVIGIPLFADEIVTADKATENINLDLKDIDIRSAIEAMFRNSGKNFALDQNVTGVNVPAVSFKDVPFDTALKSITKSMGLVYRIDQNIYIISKRPETSTTMTSYSPSIDSAPELESITSSPDVIIDKVPLNYSSASEILAIMSGNNNNGGFGNGYGGYGGFGSYGGAGGNGMSNISFGGLSSGMSGYNSGYSGYGYGNSGMSGGYSGYNRRW